LDSQALSTEGYRTAEVTLGGVDTMQLILKPWRLKSPRFIFIGEVVDVTGHVEVTTFSGHGPLDIAQV